jgi:hypothetical protein
LKYYTTPYSHGRAHGKEEEATHYICGQGYISEKDSEVEGPVSCGMCLNVLNGYAPGEIPPDNKE